MPDSAGSNPAIGTHAVMPQLVTGPVLKTGDPCFIGLRVRVPLTAFEKWKEVKYDKQGIVFEKIIRNDK